MEVWKNIKNYEGHYQVSNYGRVKSIKFNKDIILSPNSSSSGYLLVNLCNKGKINRFLIHRLVAQSFLELDMTDKKINVDHINGIRYDNKLSNLQLLSIRENICKKNIKATSKYIGVYWKQSNKKWGCQIYYNKKRLHLGYFNSEEEAHQQYLQTIKEYNITNKYSNKKKVLKKEPLT